MVELLGTQRSHGVHVLKSLGTQHPPGVPVFEHVVAVPPVCTDST